MSVLRLAAAALEVRRAQGAPGFRARLEEVAVQARDAGAHMLVLAEYFSLEAACADAPDLEGELARAVAQADALVAEAVAVARAHALWLLPGSLPMRAGGRVLNRAPLIAPDGAIHWTEKHRMTRFEAEQWGISPGAAPRAIATPWGKVGVAICYDAEFPPITRRLAQDGAFAILVPACTDTPAGATRVDISARACAIQNQCLVAVAPTIGVAPFSAALDANHGRAAIFSPADRGFPADGVAAALNPDQEGLAVAELDPAAIAAVRRDGAVRNFADWPPA